MRELREIREVLGRVPKTSAAAGSVPTIIATIYGGNAVPSTYTGDDPTMPVYPTIVPYSLPVIGSTITIADWSASKYTLPITFKHGDNVTRIEDGLCWVRLQKVSDAFGLIAWDADRAPTPNTTNIVGAAPALVEAYSQPSTDHKVTIQFDQPLTSGSVSISAYSITNPTNPVVSVASDFANGRMILTTTNAISAGASMISFASGRVADGDGSNAGSSNVLIKWIEERNCYCLCANLMAYTSYRNGDRVMVDTTKTVRIVDNLGKARVLPVIIPIGGSTLPHNHRNDATGGLAIVSPIPITASRQFESGL